MKKKLLYLLLFSFCFSSAGLLAQAIKRQSINSWGSSAKFDGKTYKETAGQSSNTNQFKGEKLTFRQGFQQAPIIYSKIITSESCLLSFYPNPLVSEATLTVPLKAKSYTIWICDIQGKVLNFEKNITVEKIAISATDYISGEYFIKVLYENGSCCTIKFMVIK